MKSRKYHPYTGDEIKKIKEMAGKFTCAEMAKEIGRSNSSVAAFCSDNKISTKIIRDELNEIDMSIIGCLSYDTFTKGSRCKCDSGLKDGVFKNAIAKLIRIGKVEYSTVSERRQAVRFYRLLPEVKFGVSNRLQDFYQYMRGSHAAR
ncbi:hypothetical protein [Rosenbergiella metrosideri]|uniref:hypothetical protein n=1 Tax=Rosenbergiella metrosideri TaxID=2921185 RepID=UPI001F4F42B5|nr:hypothetical protein [Rosenbergiella metrosideri]